MKAGRNDPCPCGSGNKFKRCCGRQPAAATPEPDASVQARLAEACAAQGKWSDAADHYARAAALAPASAAVRHGLGNALLMLGMIGQAVGSYREALAIQPDHAEAHANLGIALKRQGALAEALASFGSALRLRPDFPEVHFQVGLLHRAENRLQEAEESFRRAAAHRADYPEAHHALGLVMQAQGRDRAAIESYRVAVAQRPDYEDAHINLGNLQARQGDFPAALSSYKRAMAANPASSAAHYNLGGLLIQEGRFDEAKDALRRAIEIDPGCAEAHFLLGNAYHRNRINDQAIASLRAASALKPAWAAPVANLGVVLRDSGRLRESLQSFTAALALDPDMPEVHSNLLLAMQFDPTIPAADLLAAHRRFADRFEKPLAAKRLPHENSRDPARRLRIGYVSPDFREHAVAFYMEPVIENHDSTRFEIVGFHDSAKHDSVTARIASACHQWLECAGMSDEDLSARIRAAGIDILVDLAGHTVGNRMLTFARKPAPIQISYLGYPGTSGLASIDYRLTDGYADPADGESLYTEELLRMPDCLCCYRPVDFPEVNPLPASVRGHVTFGSFNNYNKIDAACVALWARLLQTVPESRLLMLTVPDGEARQQLREQFGAFGVAPTRLDFHGTLPKVEFRRMFLEADIALDPIAVTGGTTTCETLWMGLPVIVLCTRRYINRVGFSYLSASGHPQFAANSQDEYVEIAAKLASDIPRLAELRSGMRARMAASPLVDERRFVRNLEQAYRQVWAKWCEASSPAAPA